MLSFEIVWPLGEGGFGSLWLGVWRETGQRDGVEYVREAHMADTLRMFCREVRILQRAHAGVVRLLHADLTGSPPYNCHPSLEVPHHSSFEIPHCPGRRTVWKSENERS